MRRSRKGMKSGMKDFEAKTSPRQKVDTESWLSNVTGTIRGILCGR